MNYLHKYPKKINSSMSKKITLIFSAALFFFQVNAQQAYTYLFSSSPFYSVPSGGPLLEKIGNSVTPVTVMIPYTTCADTPVIDLTTFEFNAGFKAKAFFTSTYSIEMIFKFDELNGYNRIIDFSNSGSDYGIYTLGDCLNFYPSGNIGTCPGAFDTNNYRQIVITRNDITKEMNVYVNGSLFTNHTDANNYYIMQAAPNDTVKFFRDDNAVPNEASPGRVALIRMADYELSALDVTNSFNDFCARITGIENIKQAGRFSVFPNPVVENITINAEGMENGNYRFVLSNSMGQVLKSEELKVENNTIQKLFSVSALPAGIYFLTVGNDNATTVKKIVKRD